MVDNFEKVIPFFDFDDNEFFVYAQLVRRQKDTPEQKIKEGFIKTWILRSTTDLMKVHDDMIAMSEVLKARIYINLSPKSFKSVNNEMLVQLATYNKALNVINPNKLVNSAIGVTKSKNARWVIDIDDITLKTDIANYVNNEGVNILAEIPTKNGLHFIIPPINSKKFTETFPNVDLHPNSMGTILYIPKSLD